MIYFKECSLLFLTERQKKKKNLLLLATVITFPKRSSSWSFGWICKLGIICCGQTSLSMTCTDRVFFLLDLCGQLVPLSAPPCEPVLVFTICDKYFVFQRACRAIEEGQSVRQQQKLMKQPSLRILRPQVLS